MTTQGRTAEWKRTTTTTIQQKDNKKKKKKKKKTAGHASTKQRRNPARPQPKHVLLEPSPLNPIQNKAHCVRPLVSSPHSPTSLQPHPRRGQNAYAPLAYSSSLALTFWMLLGRSLLNAFATSRTDLKEREDIRRPVYDDKAPAGTTPPAEWVPVGRDT